MTTCARRSSSSITQIRDAVAEFIAHHAEMLGITLPMPATQLATAITCLADGLALERMKDPGSVPDELFGTMLLLIYRGLGPQGTSGFEGLLRTKSRSPLVDTAVTTLFETAESAI